MNSEESIYTNFSTIDKNFKTLLKSMSILNKKIDNLYTKIDYLNDNIERQINEAIRKKEPTRFVPSHTQSIKEFLES